MSTNLQTTEYVAVVPEIIPSRVRFPLSADKKNLFFRSLIATGGHVSKACALAKVSRQRVLEWRKTDEAFAQTYDNALEYGTENLEERLYERAMESDTTAAIFLLKARRPQMYRENIRVESEVSVNPDSANAFADSLIDRILQRKQEAARELGEGEKAQD